MRRLELVSVNREMSLIVVRETGKNGEKLEEFNVNNMTLNDFANLSMIDPRTLNDEFFKEIDLMLDEGLNNHAVENHTKFLAVRERLIENYMLTNWMEVGEQIENGEALFEDKPRIGLSDIVVVVNKKTNKVVDLLGCYREQHKPLYLSFEELTDQQKYGFIQSMPKDLIDEKMVHFFFVGGDHAKEEDQKFFKKSNKKEYLALNADVDIEYVFGHYAKFLPELHEYAISKFYCDELNV